MWEILVTLLESQRDRIYNPMHTASDTFQALRLFIAYVEPAADIHFFASVFGLEDSAGVEFEVACGTAFAELCDFRERRNQWNWRYGGASCLEIMVITCLKLLTYSIWLQGHV